MKKIAVSVLFLVSFSALAVELPGICEDKGLTTVAACKAYLKAEVAAEKAEARKAREEAQINKLTMELAKARDKAAARRAAAREADLNGTTH